MKPAGGIAPRQEFDEPLISIGEHNAIEPYKVVRARTTFPRPNEKITVTVYRGHTIPSNLQSNRLAAINAEFDRITGHGSLVIEGVPSLSGRYAANKRDLLVHGSGSLEQFAWRNPKSSGQLRYRLRPWVLISFKNVAYSGFSKPCRYRQFFHA